MRGVGVVGEEMGVRGRRSRGLGSISEEGRDRERDWTDKVPGCGRLWE